MSACKQMCVSPQLVCCLSPLRSLCSLVTWVCVHHLNPLFYHTEVWSNVTEVPPLLCLSPESPWAASQLVALMNVIWVGLVRIVCALSALFCFTTSANWPIYKAFPPFYDLHNYVCGCSWYEQCASTLFYWDHCLSFKVTFDCCVLYRVRITCFISVLMFNADILRNGEGSLYYHYI